MDCIMDCGKCAVCEISIYQAMVEMCNSCGKYELSCVGSDEQQKKCYANKEDK